MSNSATHASVVYPSLTVSPRAPPCWHSGADLQQVCREACMVGVRRLLAGKTAADIATMRAAGMLSTPTVRTVCEHAKEHTHTRS